MSSARTSVMLIGLELRLDGVLTVEQARTQARQHLEQEQQRITERLAVVDGAEVWIKRQGQREERISEEEASA